MKNENQKKLDPLQVWKDLEDLMVPRLKLTVYERAVYSHLLRHTRLEGKAQICFSMLRLVRTARFTKRAAHKALQGLHAKGALRLAGHTRAGRIIEVRLPQEIEAVLAGKIATQAAAPVPEKKNLDQADFMAVQTRRQSIHLREGGVCFYCLRRVTPMTRCLDHVVPQVRNGNNGYRNVVSACAECNGRKGVQLAEDYLRWLYREGRLSAKELSGRLRALQDLAAGRMRPGIL